MKKFQCFNNQEHNYEHCDTCGAHAGNPLPYVCIGKDYLSSLQKWNIRAL